MFWKSTCKTSFDNFGSLLGWYNFTTLGATGKNGPVSAAGHKGTLLQEVYCHERCPRVAGAIHWKVQCRSLRSIRRGRNFAQERWKGAKVNGVIKLSKGDKLAILLRQKGSTQDGSHTGSGDRATFVYRPPNKHKLYLVAGGGGSRGKENGLPGNDSPDGSGSVDTRGTNRGGGKVC